MRETTNSNDEIPSYEPKSQQEQHAETETLAIVGDRRDDEDGGDHGGKLGDGNRFGKGRKRRHAGAGNMNLKYFTIGATDSEEEEKEERLRLALKGDAKDVDTDDESNFDAKDDGSDCDGDPHEGEHSVLWEKCFHCFCPFIAIIRALIRCDMDTFWKIVPPILVTKALYSSVIALGLCTLFKVQRRTLSTTTPFLTYHTETYFFGLYTYTADVELGSTFGSEVAMEVHRVQTCRFDMREVDAEAPDRLFLDDATFGVARGFAVASASLGFLSTIMVFLVTASDCMRRCRGSEGGNVVWRNRVRWGLFGMLVSCGVFEAFAFLVLGSSVCRDIGERGFEYEDRHCSLEEGVGIIFSSCFCWFFTAFATLKMPIGGGSGDDGEVGDIEIGSGGDIGKKGRTWKEKGSFEVPTDDNGESVTIL